MVMHRIVLVKLYKTVFKGKARALNNCRKHLPILEEHQTVFHDPLQNRRSIMYSNIVLLQVYFNH